MAASRSTAAKCARHIAVAATRRAWFSGAASAESGLEVPWEQGKAVYRKLLRACKTYPSKKKDAIYEDIRLDFKDHASTTDQKLLLRYRSQALSGLEGLQQFSRVAADESKEWQTGPVRHPDPRQPHLQGTRR